MTSLGQLIKDNLRYTVEVDGEKKEYIKVKRDEIIMPGAMHSWNTGPLKPIMNADGKTVGSTPRSFSPHRRFFNPVIPEALPYFLIYGCQKMARKKNNHRLIIAHGCNGIEHAQWRCTEHLVENDHVDFAEDHGYKITGKCNGRCKGKLGKKGFFS